MKDDDLQLCMAVMLVGFATLALVGLAAVALLR